MSQAETTPLDEVDVRTAADLSADGSAVLLDVREDEEWAAGHARLARHIPLGTLDPAKLPQDESILVICRSGARSARATATLLQAGLTVRNVTGGMRAWASSGLPVTRTDGAPGEIA